MATTLLRVLSLAALCLLVPPTGSASAQSGAAEASSSSNAADTSALSQEELEQLLAPVALYPDSLLSQIFMASTYPVEIVEADRWVKANPKLTGAELTAGLEKQAWDPSVKSLVNFPAILAMMSEKLDMTTKLGDAFLAQQKDVLATVQRLRAKAKETGNLESNQQQVVTVAPAAAGSPSQIIVVESSDPEVVYVPQYNPVTVYGTWPYPSYPPYPYYPAGYVATAAISFGVGVACGAAWGYAWGDCDWHGGDVDIDINRNTNINNNIDRSKYQANFQQNNLNMQGGKGAWQHDAAHRRNLPYRDSATAQQFGGRSAAQATQARETYRGRADAGRQDIARGGADQFGTSGAAPDRGPVSDRERQGANNAANRAAAGNRPAAGADRSSAFSESRSSGSSARSASSRGSSSRAGGASRGGGRR